MGLGRSEQRLLSQIERALRGSDPKLAAALASFNRRRSHLAMPLRERLRPSRMVQYAPVAMGVFVLSMILISVTVLSRLGPTTGPADAACGIAYVQGCPSASAHTAHSATNR
ncbi:MAG TPA: DUF3040 domain-containing protein [Streptosporangiaceae bacterium]|jgi:hypothetical protein|nr:DUF3040 domain-containing protein [Streptosporangiaceae bacterium]